MPSWPVYKASEGLVGNGRTVLERKRVRLALGKEPATGEPGGKGGYGTGSLIDPDGSRFAVLSYLSAMALTFRDNPARNARRDTRSRRTRIQRRRRPTRRFNTRCFPGASPPFSREARFI